MKNITFILFLVPYLTQCQNNLSLSDAISIGMSENFDILISKENKDKSKLNNNWANAGAFPSINISSSKEEALSDQSNNPASFIQEKLKSSSINANANINWTLFNGLAIRANKEKLNYLQKISNNNVTLTIENIVQGIILQYYNCIIQKEKLDLLQKVVAKSKTRLRYEKNNYKMGLISKIDYLQIENALLSDSSQIIMQKNNYENSLKNLNLTLGVNINKTWILSDTLNIEIQVFDFEELKANTILNNTKIKNQYLNLKLAKQENKLSISPFYPIISINSGASFNESTYDIGDLASTIKNTGESINYFANFSVSLRLFNGGKLYNTIRSIKINNDINYLKTEKIKNEILHDLSTTYEKYNSLVSSYKLSKKAFEVAETNYKLATNKKNRGIINTFNFRDIEINYIRSGLNVSQSALNLIESKLSLLKITGGIIKNY